MSILAATIAAALEKEFPPKIIFSVLIQHYPLDAIVLAFDEFLESQINNQILDSTLIDEDTKNSFTISSV